MLEQKTYFKVRRVSIVTSLTTAFLLLGVTMVFFVVESTRASQQKQGLSDSVGVIVTRLDQVEQSLLRINEYSDAIERLTRVERRGDLRKDLKITGPFNDGLGNGRSGNHIADVASAVMRLNLLASDAGRLEKRLSTIRTVVDHRKDILTTLPSISPTQGSITSGFGVRISPFTKTPVMHKGIDIKADEGTPVVASAAGTIIFAGVGRDLGKFVAIDHGYGVVTKYGHNSSLKVNAGDKVKRGQIISTVGNTGHSTGPHLHYEVYVNDVAVDPMAFVPDVQGDSTGLASLSGETANVGGSEDVPVAQDELASIGAGFGAQVKEGNLAEMTDAVVKKKKNGSSMKWSVPLAMLMGAGLLLLIAIAMSMTRGAERQFHPVMVTVHQAEQEQQQSLNIRLHG